MGLKSNSLYFIGILASKSWTTSPQHCIAILSSSQTEYTGQILMMFFELLPLSELSVLVSCFSCNFEVICFCSREVTVRLLISQWNYTIPDMYSHLQSIQTLDNVHVKLFKVPGTQVMNHYESALMGFAVYKEYIPYTRVNHAKYMVTEKQAFITTSNWYVCSVSAGC